MGRRPSFWRRNFPAPRLAEVINVLDQLELAIREMAGRWTDAVPGPVRMELHEMPALRQATELLLRLKRR